MVQGQAGAPYASANAYERGTGMSERHGQAPRGEWKRTGGAKHTLVQVVGGALALTVFVVLLPFAHWPDFASDVISMVILIGTLTFARALDRRSGAIMALLAGAIAAIVPGVPAFPPRSLWEAALRCGAFVMMTAVYYRVIVALRTRDERAQRQLDDLRALHTEVRALHTLITATDTTPTYAAVSTQVVQAAGRLSGGWRSCLLHENAATGAWQTVAAWPDTAGYRETDRVRDADDDVNVPFTVRRTGQGWCITVPLVTQCDGTMLLEVDCPPHREEGRDRDERAQLLAVYARDVGLTLDHVTLQGQFAHLMLTEERGRIARELHDGLVQSLGGIAYRIEYYGETLRADNVANVRHGLNASAVEVRKALREARLMIYGLRDVSGSDDLHARLLALLDEVANQTGMAVVADLPPAMPPLSAAQAEAVYGVAREALQNVVKHSEAESVSVAFLVEPAQVELTVTDDGRGFTYPDGDRRAFPLCYGMTGMTERAAQQGGRVIIQTQPEMGTCVTLTLPRDSAPRMSTGEAVSA